MSLVSCVQSSFDDEHVSVSNSSLDESSVNEIYYWMGGEKHYLSVDNNKEYVVLGSDIQENEERLLDSGSINVALNCSQSRAVSKLTRKMKWGVLESNSTKKTRFSYNDKYIYSSPCYKDESGAEHIVSNFVYIKLKQSEDSVKLISLAKQYNVEIIGENPYLKKWYTLYCTNKSIGNSIEIANKFYETGDFIYAEPDVLPSEKDLCCSYNDQYYSDQWNLHGSYSINWEAASEITKGKGAIVGVIDRGIDMLHPDFGSNVSVGYDAYQNAWYTNNLYGNHGMWCVGVIGAKANNKIGVAGIASEASIVSYSDPLMKNPNAIQNLATDLAIAISSSDVVSCSWGGKDLESDMIKDAIFDACWGRQNKGTVVVFAAGNSNGKVAFPANCDENVIVVGGLNKQGRRFVTSNYGRELDVVAPAEDIPTLNLQDGKNPYGYYFRFSETSSACPQVAAVAALIISVNPKLTRKEIKAIIERTTNKVGGYSYQSSSEHPNGTWNNEVGYGLVNAYAAVKEAQKTLK